VFLGLLRIFYQHENCISFSNALAFSSIFVRNAQGGKNVREGKIPVIKAFGLCRSLQDSYFHRLDFVGGGTIVFACAVHQRLACAKGANRCRPELF